MFIKHFTNTSLIVFPLCQGISIYPTRTVECTLYCIYDKFLLDGWMISMSFFRFYIMPFAHFSLSRETNEGGHKVSISHQSLHRASGTSCPCPGKWLPAVAELHSKKQSKGLFKFLAFSCLSRVCLLFWALGLCKTALPQTVEQT